MDHDQRFKTLLEEFFQEFILLFWPQLERALARLVECKENMARKYLLCECVQAYSPLTKKQRQELDELLVSEPYSRVKAMNKTWKEQGEEDGYRKMLQGILEERFGTLKASVKKKLQQWPADRLLELAKATVKAESLKDLGLEK